jgi:hypothetical protein
LKAVKVDNDTLHWNCQDYVMEILERLEEECVIDLDSDSGSDVDSGGGSGIDTDTGDDVDEPASQMDDDRESDDDEEEEDKLRNANGPRGRGGGSLYARQKRQLKRWFGPII